MSIRAFHFPRTIIFFGILIPVFFFGGLRLEAEETEQDKTEQPRYMLSPSFRSEERNSSSERNLGEADFEWEQIVHDGPAAGSNPVIGDRNIQSYYDFRDGHELPYYVVKKIK